MTRSRSASPALALGACAAWIIAIYATAITVVSTSLLARDPALMAAAVAFDLTVTASAAVYLLGVRRGHLPWWTLLSTVTIGAAAAKALLPAGTPVLAGLAGLALLAEVGLAALAISRGRRVVAIVRARRADGDSLVSALEDGFAAALPGRLAAMLAGELVAVTLAITGWVRRTPATGFSMHRTKLWGAYAGLLVLVIAAETTAVHVAIAPAWPVVAWIATASSIYAAVWLVGDAHALRLTPARLTPSELIVDVGLRWRLRVDRAAIVAVERCDAVPEGALRLAVVEPTVLITLRAPVTARGPLGIRRTGDRIALTIDDVDGFVAALATPAPHGSDKA